MATMLATKTLPVYSGDIFSDEALLQPYSLYRTLRDLGPVVRLHDPDLYALSRFQDVRAALQAHAILISGEGVGLNEVFNKPAGSTLLMMDGEPHRRLRSVVGRPLLPKEVERHRVHLRSLVEANMRSFLDTWPFDAMAHLARHVPAAIITDLVGLPEEGREQMWAWADAIVSTIGPRTDGFETHFQNLGGWYEYQSRLKWSDLREGGWADGLKHAIAEGVISEREARGVMGSYVLPALDTTALSIGHLLALLAGHPDQWRQLKQDRSRVRAAVNEALRHSAIVRWFSRVAAADYAIGDHVVPKGARVLVMYASANRDEREYPDPDRFDISRDSRSQLGFGSGIHACLGMSMARMEMEVLLETLLDLAAEISSGEPELLLNQGVYGFQSLPFEMRS